MGKISEKEIEQMNYLEIEKVIGREILDSRGNPTVEAEVTLVDGTVARGTAPSGASTGEFEALELRDGDKARYLGKGVTKAVENINTVIADVIVGMDASDIYAVDKAMIEADGTKDKSKGLATSVGDEGGFAPDLASDEEAIQYILEAVKNAGYEPGKDFMIAMDAASSEWKGAAKGEYTLPKAGTKFTSDGLIEHWKQLVDKYPIISIEDALDEADWEGWQKLTKELGDRVQLVGDDLFVTNTERLKKGIDNGCGNCILIKLNQIGSVSETLEAIKMAHKAGYTAVSSHRSGETEDTTIADLAVALNTCQIKTGAPSRSERVAKYNQLLRIEEELGASAIYPGMGAFNVNR